MAVEKNILHMKPILFRNLIPSNASFLLLDDELPHFYDFLHYHPEFQLTVILKGKGTAFVGDNIGEFEAGDVYFIGSNTPHVFRNEREAGHNAVHSQTIYFNWDSFGKGFFDLPENINIKDMLLKSSRGIKFSTADASVLTKEVGDLAPKIGIDRLLHLFSLLHCMSKSTQFQLLSSITLSKIREDAENKRIQLVYEYVMQHFSKDITLEEIADISNMSVTSFCRFFKQRTKKTFTEFLNEIRIGHACKELIYSDYNINEIAYKCGYNNISNFNRQFKEITKFTPSEYIRKAG